MELAVKPVANVPAFVSQLQDARGVALLGAGDAAAAVSALKQCLAADFQCQYDLVLAQEKAGDHAGAEATRAAFLKTPRRSLEYVYLWKKLGGSAK